VQDLPTIKKEISKRQDLQDENNIAVNGTRVLLLPCQRRC